MWRRTFLAGLAAALTPGLARAEHYLDPRQAARLLFPEADDFSPASAELDGKAAELVKTRSGMRVRQKKIDSLAAHRGGQTVGWVYIDEVIGKHEFITYAVGVDAHDAVRGVEVLDYRETWGGAIRQAVWRNQFRGLTLATPPRLLGNIDNVSGATLSCRNVTDGVRRILATHAVLGR